MAYPTSDPEPTVPFGSADPHRPFPTSQPTPYAPYAAHPEPSNQQLYPTYAAYPAGPQQPNPYQLAYVPVDPRLQAYQNGLYAAQKSRVAAGLLGIFLGTLGVHNFYLGRTGIAVLQLLLSVLSMGILAPGVAVWSLIEGILILTRSPSFATDRKGIPLRD